MSATIHWLGAGLSSIPGIEKLAQDGRNVIVWNRSLGKAQTALSQVADKIEISALDWSLLADKVKSGDILISMLPATMHIKVAELCLEKKAHFVSSSYISPEMQALHQQAKDANLCFVNEVGLDPGLDHILAHALVENYKNSAQYHSDNKLYFRSYCGGFPKIANDFKYKFSWSPLGVLKALKSPAKWLQHGEVGTSNAPWEALADYSIDLAQGSETFQCYPNRDSLPFIKQYHLADENVQQFVRGTLRLAGWSDAWSELFDKVAQLTSSASADTAEQELKTISESLERQYSYDEGEPDRVVLHVDLEAKNADGTVWQQSYLLDSSGNEKGQAMARLVSVPVSFAIESVLNNVAEKGVSAAPHQTKEIASWIQQLSDLGEVITHQVVK
ncbi:saccharopine dehydrogenase C-terminal domain-containing protein [Colwellia sp. RSH04]|uniref:saccharopine dehydrogenase C-terminal domain-containing protein n=1 Tax=Colwellia sp. RSH04 TaxID=2305464 RepID=UPI000E589C61|nr:saccharopine dehydrogenase C-terminal domain-containing protein [Colwellia sp. RSH04]RHW76257.1 saccharopine dehydrogenase [Colwellia sp. RSH04]